MTGVRRLNHAVLYVRDARRSAAFYAEAFGFEVLAEYGDGAAVFMRAADTDRWLAGMNKMQRAFEEDRS